MSERLTLPQIAPWIPGTLTVAWWVWELSHHWAALVEYQFGWIVVVLAAFLAWERFPNQPARQPGKHSVLVTLLAVVGFVAVLGAELYRIGLSRTPTQVMLMSLGCAAFLLAQMLALGGWAWTRNFLFPLLFFFVAVPIPKILWNPIVFGLQAFVTTLNVEALNLMGVPALQHGHVIQLPNTSVGVDEACSGVRSLQSSIMATLFIGDLTLRRTGWKVFFFIAGVTLAVVGNFGRSLYLSVTAYRGGPDALNAVHDSAGWSVLVFTAVGMCALGWVMTRIEKRLQQQLTAMAEASQSPPPAV